MKGILDYKGRTIYIEWDGKHNNYVVNVPSLPSTKFLSKNLDSLLEWIKEIIDDELENE